jgi:hypothetical protein
MILRYVQTQDLNVSDYNQPLSSLLVKARGQPRSHIVSLSPSEEEIDLQAAIFKPEVSYVVFPLNYLEL